MRLLRLARECQLVGNAADMWVVCEVHHQRKTGLDHRKVIRGRSLLAHRAPGLLLLAWRRKKRKKCPNWETWRCRAVVNWRLQPDTKGETGGLSDMDYPVYPPSLYR